MDSVKIPWPEWRAARVLGRGGFGTVYEIERDLLESKEKAAMKVITIPKDQSEVEADYNDGYDNASISRKYEGYLKQIVNEYKLMSELKGHSNIVNCDDVKIDPHADGIGWDVYIRMELLTPLPAWLKEHAFTEEDTVRLGKDLCRALTVCEGKNIIHRDIKPENIMISDLGNFKLGDFGIARTMDHTTNATFAGTERYMAPEVIRREKYGKEVDIYSLGLVMYWLLNRRRMPFLPIDRLPTAGEAQAAQARRVQGEPIPPPADGGPALKKIVLKACAYDRKARYGSAAEMLDDLENGLNAASQRTASRRTVSRRTASQGTDSGAGFSGTAATQKTIGGMNRGSAEGSASGPSMGNSWADTQGTIGKPRGGGRVAPDSGESQGTVGAVGWSKRKDTAQKETAAGEQAQPEKPASPTVWAFMILGGAVFNLWVIYRIYDISLRGVPIGMVDNWPACIGSIGLILFGLILVFYSKNRFGACPLILSGAIPLACIFQPALEGPLHDNVDDMELAIPLFFTVLMAGAVDRYVLIKKAQEEDAVPPKRISPPLAGAYIVLWCAAALGYDYILYANLQLSPDYLSTTKSTIDWIAFVVTLAAVLIGLVMFFIMKNAMGIWVLLVGCIAGPCCISNSFLYEVLGLDMGGVASLWLSVHIFGSFKILSWMVSYLSNKEDAKHTD